MHRDGKACFLQIKVDELRISGRQFGARQESEGIFSSIITELETHYYNHSHQNYLSSNGHGHIFGLN